MPTPPQTVQKSPKLVHVHTNVSYASRTVVTFKSHPKCLKACLIKSGLMFLPAKINKDQPAV